MTSALVAQSAFFPLRLVEGVAHTQNPKRGSSSLNLRRPVPKLCCSISSKPNRPAESVRISSTFAIRASDKFHGQCYVVGDNIDTDQIIPVKYRTLASSQLGSYALDGFRDSSGAPFVEPGATKSNYSIIIAGGNFGSGSSPELAAVALCDAGAAVVVAESYGRSFLNYVEIGGAHLLKVAEGIELCEECETGDAVTVELSDDGYAMKNHTTGREYVLTRQMDHPGFVIGILGDDFSPSLANTF